MEIIIAWKKLENTSLSYNKYRKFSWDKTGVSLGVCWVILTFTALKRGRAYETSNVLLLELEKDIEEREETLSFSLYFLLETRIKVTSSTSSISAAILILGEDLETRSRL